MSLYTRQNTCEVHACVVVFTGIGCPVCSLQSELDEAEMELIKLKDRLESDEAYISELVDDLAKYTAPPMRQSIGRVFQDD